MHPDYCRSRYKINGKPIVEFNIKYFDDKFADADYKIRVLKLFPEEFRKAYLSYKRGTLKKDFNGVMYLTSRKNEYNFVTKHIKRILVHSALSL